MRDYSELALGRQAYRPDPRNLRFASYLAVDLGPPPDHVSRTRGRRGWGMLGNDLVGDCTIAAAIHSVQSLRLSLDPEFFDVADTVALDYYSLWAGYRAGEPDTDRGAVELDILKRWRKDGLRLGGYTHNLKAFAEIDWRDQDAIKHAIDLFGFVYLGVALPRAIQKQEIWHPASGHDGIPGTWGLHAVIADNYDRELILLQTWGEQQPATWEWFAECCDEAYGLVSDTDWKNPDGFDRDALLADLEVVTHMHRAG